MDWLPENTDGARLLDLEIFLFADLDLAEYQAPPPLDHLHGETTRRRYVARGTTLTLPSQFGNLEQYLSY
ncbi:MAG: hypothetical protein IT381_31200 [Deltaproteobacteria bacterium]|nr:hypothetical protein [Deltaproteobacteria bacterium]